MIEVKNKLKSIESLCKMLTFDMTSRSDFFLLCFSAVTEMLLTHMLYIITETVSVNNRLLPALSRSHVSM